MFFSEKKETFFSESDLSILFKRISQNFAQWMSQKQIFKNIKGSRFGLGIRFDFENPNPGSVGSRFDFLEVRRFEVWNFQVRPKTIQEYPKT